MKPQITFENLDSYAYSNASLCQEIRGIVLSFFGLGGMHMYSDHPQEAYRYASHGLLYVVPYNNPWAWMNRQAIAYTDEILDVIFAHFCLPASTPIVATGGSMGGLSAIVYCRYAKRTPTACVANCPVCDLPYHFTERPDLPRTIYSAFWNEPGDLDEVLARYSPLHLVVAMPKIPYTIFHCTADLAVNKDLHSDRFVAAMKETGHSITYHTVEGRGHCDLTPDMWECFFSTVIEATQG